MRRNMTPVEKMEAAILKLDRLKAESTRVWARSRNDLEAVLAEREVGLSFGDLDDADAELVLTLHRTIDAQLAVLRAGRTAWMISDGDSYGWSLEARALSEPLADAILGEDS